MEGGQWDVGSHGEGKHNQTVTDVRNDDLWPGSLFPPPALRRFVPYPGVIEGL